MKNYVYVAVIFLMLSHCHAALIIHFPMDTDDVCRLPKNVSVQPVDESCFVKGMTNEALAVGSSCPVVFSQDIPLKLIMTDAVSIGCWFKAKNSFDGAGTIVSVGPCQLTMDEQGKSSCFEVKLSDSKHPQIGALSRVRGYSNLGDGAWHYVMGIYDGRIMAIYVDGVMEGVADVPGKLFAGESVLAVGGVNQSLFYIDELRVYNEAVGYSVIVELTKNRIRRQDGVACLKVDLHRDFLAKGIMPIQAHRGGGLLLPENTLETYRQTWKRGIIPEADIRTTKDGVIICMHDDTPERLAPNAPKPLKGMLFEEMTLDQVKCLDVGEFRNQPGQKVPTLEEVFADMRGRPERMLELDYKNIDFRQLCELIDKYDVRGQAVFVSKENHLICQWQKLTAGSVAMQWMGGSEQALTKIFEQLRRDDFAGISILQIIVFNDKKSLDGFRPSLAFLLERRAELEKRQIALRLIPWKISDRAVYDKLVQAGFCFFGTDYPDIAIEAYKKVLAARKNN